MFFEPLPAGTETPAELPESPPWSGPPRLEAGAVLAVDQTVARSANVVVRLPTIRAFGAGCLLAVDVVSRQLSDDDWWLLRFSPYGFDRLRGGVPLPPRLLRLGVRYSDGRKSTTLESQVVRRKHASDDPPTGPRLALWPASSGMHGRPEVAFRSFAMWLWPLPPAEAFEFAVEWPFGGIELTIVELDGAAIVGAAGRPARYWPESEQATESDA
jgi:hypothetical protein